MKQKERDIWDDAIRSKLEDFEVDTLPGDWEAIADRLPGKAPVPLRHTLRYWVVAAVISLLVVSGGLYVFDQDIRTIPVAKEVERQSDMTDFREERQPLASMPTLAVEPDQPDKQERVPVTARAARVSLVTNQPVVTQSIQLPVEPEEAVKVAEAGDEVSEMVDNPVAKNEESVVIVTKSNSLVADVSTGQAKKRKEAPARKWGFGMGGGGLSMGADNFVPQYVTNSAMFKSENLAYLNSFKEEERKTEIHHKTPIGLGISINRYLNNRFALQTGLTYSYLRSEWSTNGSYHIENDQRLHFIGIPLSLTYKIAEWNRFLFYASAGGMAEVNVAGKRRMRLFSDDNEIIRQSEKVRMKEWLWSVNARAGVSYPIIRFVSAFAEVGAAYYFDNGSEIETVHSEKPFNVSLQFGFRFGF